MSQAKLFVVDDDDAARTLLAEALAEGRVRGRGIFQRPGRR